MNKAKKLLRIAIATALIAALCIASTCAAVERASAYIHAYSMNVIPAGSGVIGIEFSVDGTGTMSAIGAESITIYRGVGTKWVYVDEFTRDDEGMIDTKTFHHGNTMTFYGTAGERYKVTVTIFAENSKGSDSRTEHFILTA